MLVSLDLTEPRAGAHSLRFQFDGAPDASARLATQLVTVEPGARYRLRFAARSENLLSGGPPVVAVLDAGKGERPLALAPQLPTGTRGWEDYRVEFVAPEAPGAVLVVIRRQPCAQAPAPSSVASGSTTSLWKNCKPTAPDSAPTPLNITSRHHQFFYRGCLRSLLPAP